MIYNSYDNIGLIKVLSFLKSHKSEFLSGQDLSDVLKISRVAVWKHIKKISSLGYEIESKQKKGYKLVQSTNLLLPWEITDGLKTKAIGRRAYYFDSIDSTQNYALKIAQNRVENGSVIIAGKQTEGKGRLGRKWVSPQGGIWMSIILHPTFDVSYATLFPIASAVALSSAIEKTIGIKSELKWPNDVILKNKKVAGMIVDASLESNTIQSLILGVGINFKINPASLEKNITQTENFYGVSTLIKDENSIKPIKLVQSFLYELEKIYDMIGDGKIKPIVKKWSEKSSTLGKMITVSTFDGKITGKAIKIDDDGALVLKDKTKTHRIIAGDVIHIN